jgi:hypothetical protein
VSLHATVPCLPIYEPLAADDELRAGANFLPMIADALKRLTVA